LHYKKVIIKEKVKRGLAPFEGPKQI
jgi:hypothetical protein